MELAQSIAERSHSDRLKVGCVVVSSDNTTVLSNGYNGIEALGLNQVDVSAPGKEGTVHAEINALIKLDFHYSGYKKMYLTVMPCLICARAIINANIDEVIYKEDYRDDSGIKLLENSRRNIWVRKYKLDEKNKKICTSISSYTF